MKRTFTLVLFTVFLNLITPAYAEVMRLETPNPQMERKNWLSLNGEWEFDYSDGEGETHTTGKIRSTPLLQKINVPFAPETFLSGIGNAQFDPKHDVVWYRRIVKLPAAWNRSALLHFGGVDYEAEIYVDGKLIGVHRGGYTAFSFNLSSVIKNDSFELMVRAFDPATSTQIARGKQEILRNEGNIFYNKSTGIRESVWVEKIGNSYLKDIKLDPDVSGNLSIKSVIAGQSSGLTLKTSVYLKGQVVAEATTTVSGKTITNLKLPRVHLWSPNAPTLYDLKITLVDGDKVVDEIFSYTGFKSIEKKDGKIFLNGKRLIQKLVLDQGYYPESGYTPVSAAQMEQDILLAKKAGFNGARFHQQTANAYKRYLADKHGYLYWVELPSARDLRDVRARNNFFKEGVEIFHAAKNGVGFIVAVGFNETWGLWQMSPAQQAREQIALARLVYPILPSQALYSPNDGWQNISGVDDKGHPIPELADIRKRLILSLHDYPEVGLGLYEMYNKLGARPAAGTYIPRNFGRDQAAFVEGFGFDPEAVVFLSEYGGVTTYFPPGPIPDYLFGYHRIERDAESAISRILHQFNTISTLKFFGGGSCYTQLRDTKYEKNGLFEEDGKLKYPMERFSQGFYEYRDVVQSSEDVGQAWKYTTSNPPAEWFKSSFNDSLWKVGTAGFGTTGTPGAVVRTNWDTNKIWLRRHFYPGNLSASDLDNLFLRIHHDENAEVYINGVHAVSLKSHSQGYVYADISKAAKEAIIMGGDNVIAVHVEQTIGGQAIDVGLSVRTPAH